jgi:hypothetical protein
MSGTEASQKSVSVGEQAPILRASASGIPTLQCTCALFKRSRIPLRLVYTASKYRTRGHASHQSERGMHSLRSP